MDMATDEGYFLSTSIIKYRKGHSVWEKREGGRVIRDGKGENRISSIETTLNAIDRNYNRCIVPSFIDA